jgi:hypothetical protein
MTFQSHFRLQDNSGPGACLYLQVVFQNGQEENQLTRVGAASTSKKDP